MSAEPSTTWYIALVVVRHGDRFVVVNEKKDRGWFLPAGRVDPGETLQQGAKREVLEESGLEVELDGILRMEFTPALDAYDARFRVVFLAHPVGGTMKTEPDHESLGAAWVTLDEAAQLRLRGREVLEHFGYVARGAPIAPMSLLTREGAPYA